MTMSGGMNFPGSMPRAAQVMSAPGRYIRRLMEPVLMRFPSSPSSWASSEEDTHP